MTDEVKDAPKAKAIANKGPDWWLREIGRSTGDWKTYRERAKKVVERYRDEREDSESRNNGKRFNILFSNTETLGPAIYSQPPVPDIRRRWQDKDPVGRLAALVLQRATAFCLESYDFDAVLDACKGDYLLPGFAVARIKYKPYFKKTPKLGEDKQPVMGPDKKPAFDEEIIYQEATTEYVAWDRFAMSRSKIYERVWWVAFADDLTKDEVALTFGQDTADKLPYSRREQVESDEKEGSDPTCRVWEVWSKRDRKRGFVAEGYEGWVREPEADPLRLQNFFPNAKPLWSITTNNTLKPIPEYLEYQDQARELDDLTDRIDVLTSALRRRGVYDATNKDVLENIVNAGDNDFKAITNWQALQEKGGLQNLVAELPIEGIAKIILQLDERRERVKQTIYEVTGIADIVRGSSNPNETLGAQQLKGKWAGLRISSRQKKFANFARDLVRMKAEIIAERFDQNTLSLMSGVKLPTAEEKQQAQMAMQQYQQIAAQAQQAQQQPPPPPIPPEQMKFYQQPSWEEVLTVLRSDKLRGFKIDIETDSTVQPDADAEKAARSELLQAVGGFSQQVAPAIQLGIIKKKTAIELIQFAVNSFKVGSRLEEDLDESANQPEGPTPEMQQQMQQLQAKEQELMQREAKVKDAEHGAQMATKDAKAAAADVKHRQEIYDLTKRFQDQVDALEQQFNSTMQRAFGEAERAVGGVVEEVMNARAREGAPAQPEGAA